MNLPLTGSTALAAEVQQLRQQLAEAETERVLVLEQTRKTCEFHRDMAARFAVDRDEQKHRARNAESALMALRQQIEAMIEELTAIPDPRNSHLFVIAGKLRALLASQTPSAPTEQRK